MATVETRTKTSAGYEHTNGEGKLISKSVDIHFPDFPPLPPRPVCSTSDCIKKYKDKLDDWLGEYKRELDFYVLLCLYHQARIEYVYRHRDDDIPMKYRTGEPAPETYIEIMKEITKLKIRR